MNIEKIINEMFQDIIEDYENEKMIQNKGCIKKTTAQEILGGK